MSRPVAISITLASLVVLVCLILQLPNLTGDRQKDSELPKPLGGTVDIGRPERIVSTTPDLVRLSGTVLTPDRVPVESCVVQLDSKDFARELSTDVDGRFRTERLRSGEYKLLVQHAVWGSIVLDPLRIDSTLELTLSFEARCVLHGTVVGAGGQARNTTKLWLDRNDTEAIEYDSITISEDGIFECRGLSPNGYEVLGTHNGKAIRQMVSFATNGEEQSVVIDVSSGFHETFLEGHAFLDSQSNPLVEARMVLAITNDGSQANYEVQTDATGYFFIESDRILPGTSIRYFAPDHANTFVDMPFSDSTSPVTVVFDTTRQRSGVVQTSEGLPLPWAFVVFRNTAHEKLYFFKETGEAGTFDATDLTPGPYQAWLEDAEGRTETEFEVSDGKSPVVVTLPFRDFVLLSVFDQRGEILRGGYTYHVKGELADGHIWEKWKTIPESPAREGVSGATSRPQDTRPPAALVTTEKGANVLFFSVLSLDKGFGTTYVETATGETHIEVALGGFRKILVSVYRNDGVPVDDALFRIPGFFEHAPLLGRRLFGVIPRDFFVHGRPEPGQYEVTVAPGPDSLLRIESSVGGSVELAVDDLIRDPVVILPGS